MAWDKAQTIGNTGFFRLVLIIPYGHTFATLALQNGVDVKTLSGLLGHYSAGFTLDTYGHITKAMKQDAAEKVGSFLAGTV